MFCFKIWSRFGAFRDPLTITQNLTFPIPPKTTVGGMLAAVLGLDYREYFEDPGYFDFSYSLVLTRPVRKKSFAQNYVADYTKRSEKKNRVMTALTGTASESAREKCVQSFTDGFRSPKPIFRELLVDPEYLVFIEDFKYEARIIPLLKGHETAFSLYMGNSEFPANFRFMESGQTQLSSDSLDSFTAHGSGILFEEDKKYTNVFMATRVTGQREYRDYRPIVLCDGPIRLKRAATVRQIDTDTGRFNCEFI